MENKFIQIFWGHGNGLNMLQMGSRAAVMFFIAFILIRFGGIRIFGKKTAFDEIIVIMLGAVLSRGIVGANPFWSTVAAGAVMILIHKALAYLSVRSKKAERILKGERTLLFKDGQLLKDNLNKVNMSEEEFMQSLYLETNQDTTTGISTSFAETSGRISFILDKNKS